MKANEFLKENGLKKCSRIVEDLIEQGNDSEFVKNLKRLVDSHELVGKYGADKINQKIKFLESIHLLTHANQLKQAIADVESCNENPN